MIDTIKRIHAAVGSPKLDNHHAADQFTAQVAATLHFGSEKLGIKGNPAYGRRRNPSNILSDDVIGIKTGSGASDADYFDYIHNAGAANWSFVWNPSSGGPWVAPSPDDVVGTANPGTPTDPDPDPEPIDLSNLESHLNEIRVMLGGMMQLMNVQNSINERLVGSLDALGDKIGGVGKLEGHVNEIKALLDNQQKIIIAESHALRDQVKGGIKIRF